MPVNYTDPSELLAVVDEDDNEIGAERRDVIHRDHLLHRAIHLFVFRPNGDLLLQQRSAKKDRFPLHWECVGGHLGPGELYDDCVVREASEELGIVINEVTPVCKVSASDKTDYEFIKVYRTITDSEPQPNEDEISEMVWMGAEQWGVEIQEKRRLFSPVLLHTIRVGKILNSHA